MGQAASAELRTAQATISTLTKDLAAARSTLAATEAKLSAARDDARAAKVRSARASAIIPPTRAPPISSSSSLARR